MRKFGYSYLENEFILNSRVNFMVCGSLILFPEKSAIEFIRLCKSKNIKILGIDGFHVVGDKIQPDQDHVSEDFYDLSIENSFTKSIDFLEERKDTGLWFEIVTETEI